MTLREHQRTAARRLRSAMRKFGGALLADDVGLGKTFTALAAVRGARSLAIVAPAALRGMWRGALEHAAMDGVFHSLEAMSRRGWHGTESECVIVDEAHHARNPRTQRYANLASFTRRARVLLLSATPIHNSDGDLHALLALFLGSRAARMTPADRAACIVRRSREDVGDADLTPRRATPVWLDLRRHDDLLEMLLAIPPPCAARDEGDAAVLVSLSLVRCWASSHGALRGALRRRLARAEALVTALEAGRFPTRTELAAWISGDGAVQLAFPDLVVSAGAPAQAPELLGAVRRHASAVRDALSALASSADCDGERADLVRDIRRRHRGEQIVVFSQFAETVTAIYARLRADGGVAALTARGARVAGGSLSRWDALARFAPRALGVGQPSAAESIVVLIATDLLSEGLNLQDASVVIHLDLPWTSARLAQRVGRVWRIGSAHATVSEYAIAPPAPAETVLRSLERLRAKAGAAWRHVGDLVVPLLGCAAPALTDVGSPAATEALRRTLSGWLGTSVAPTLDGAVALAAAVESEREGWIALLAVDDATVLVGGVGSGQVTEDPRLLLPLIEGAGGSDRVVSASLVGLCLATVERHVAERRGADEAGSATAGSTAHVQVAAAIDSVVALAPPHRRAGTARLASGARAVVERSSGAGAERALTALAAERRQANGSADGDTWLERIIALEPELTKKAPGRDGPDGGAPLSEAPRAGAARVRALLLLLPSDATLAVDDEDVVP